MRNISKTLLSLSIATVVMVAACQKKDDGVVSKKALPLSGAQEVPVKTTEASGKVDISYNKSNHMLTYTVSWSMLTGTPTGSHIHGTAPRGMNAGIKHDFFSLFPKTTSGTFTNSVLIDGVAIKEDSLLNGFYYMNIHTAMNPGGEIRGQLEFK